MRLPSECYQMQKTIETHLPHLSQPQLTGLALWVCGAILAGSACQNAVASALSPWGKWNGRRQRLREWLYDGSDRARPCQTELDVTLCFAPLLRWWRSERLALAIDPTLKGEVMAEDPFNHFDGPHSPATSAGTQHRMIVGFQSTDAQPTGTSAAGRRSLRTNFTTIPATLSCNTRASSWIFWIARGKAVA